MQSITFDCRQLETVDWDKNKPSPIPSAAARRRTDGVERQTLISALRFGGKFDDTAAKAHTVTTIATSPPTARILAGRSTGTGSLFSVRLSTSRFVTGAFGLASSATAGYGILAGCGVYGSSTRELGVYMTYGGGIFLSYGVSGGAEMTVIYGTPADFSGLYFGLSVGGGVGVLGGGGTLLFSPSMPLGKPPIVLTLMGYSIGVNVSTPGGSLPVNVAITVTNTEIKALHRW